MTDIPIIYSALMVAAMLGRRKRMTRRLGHRIIKKRTDHEVWKGGISTQTVPSPWTRVKPGDRLWVRESFKLISIGPGSTRGITYMTDPSTVVSIDAAGVPKFGSLLHGSPSIHMPRVVSRLTLVVTAVKTERLQDISNEDALAEGVVKLVSGDRHDGYGIPGSDIETRSAPAAVFAELWMSLHGGESWNQNPEIVAISFDVHETNIDQMK